jgi:2-C-methyl-D-erythritol 4-phosphate cytidylyltransferase
MNDEYLALIPAAGIGSRAQLNTVKQFSKIGEKTIIEHAMDLFIKDDNCKTICVATNEDNELWKALAISNHQKVVSCFGGSTRMASVLAGLEMLMDKEDKSSLVVIHDAARPCLQKSDLTVLLDYAEEEIKEDGQGAFLAYQPSESISQSKKEMISGVLDRSKIWLSATPQVFILEDVFSALSEAVAQDKTFTDEVSAVYSHFKSEIKPINSSRMNLKVTRKEDIEVAELYLKLIGRS